MSIHNSTTWLEATDAFIDVHCGAAQLVDMLCQEGEHPDVLLRKTRLFMKDFGVMEKCISPEQLAQLYFNATLSQASDALAFKLGQRILPTALGSFSNGLIHAPDLRHAIDYLVDSAAIWSPLLSLHIKYHDRKVYLSFIDKFGLLIDKTLKQFVISYSLSAIYNILHWIGSPQLFNNWTVDLETCSQQAVLEFNAWIPSEINLEQAFFTVSIPEERLADKFNKASNTLFMLNHKRLFEQSLSHTSLLDLMRSKMANNIQAIPSVNQIADELFISTATLKRKLKKHNTNYQELVDEMRSREVHFLQKKQLMNETEVAKKLNFYDVSNLRRAKRRWAVP